MAATLDLLLQVAGPEKRDEIVTIHEQKGFAEAVSHVWDNIISVDPVLRYSVEHAVTAHDKENVYYKLFVDEFKMKEHFSQVCSHRKFVKKAFLKVQKFLQHMKLEDAERHDLSKYTLAQAVGYTARWVHGLSNNSWDQALIHHYENEPHHPQYFKGERMEPRFLEESLVDMIGSRWERNLGGAEDASLQDLVDFNPIYLSRYNAEDLEAVKNLIEVIRNGKPDPE
jgi:hypothetical protein